MSTLETLVNMGFAEKNVQRAIEVTGDKGVEPAMEWLLAHADDATLGLESTPMETASSETAKTEDENKSEDSAKSIKCDECGKLFRTPEEVEFHAVKSGHSAFSESTEEKAALTEEQKRAKLADLEEKMKERRRAKAEEEEREALDKEKKRIEMGKSMIEIKRKMEEDEMKKIAEERKRDKLEDKLARDRVKAQIEADKEARRLKLAALRGEAPPKPVVVPQAAPVQSSAPKNYDETRLQFRFPSGPPAVQSFKAKEPLSAVKVWLNINHPSADGVLTPTLSTNFPRKTFTEEDMEKPLDILGLVPSCALTVQYK